MKYLELQPRLEMIASLVPKNARIVDVGTDHGYIPVYLLQHNIIQYAIASDIGIEPLNHAKKTAAIFGIDSIEFHVCDGLNGITLNSIDTIIIAGMGGETIISIIDNAIEAIDSHTFILQPMTKSDLLRSWLNSHSLCIIEEHLVRDKAYIYPILIVRKGKQHVLSNVELLCGVNDFSDPLYETFINQKITSVSHALEGLKCSKTPNQDKILEYSSLLHELKTVRG